MTDINESENEGLEDEDMVDEAEEHDVSTPPSVFLERRNKDAALYDQWNATKSPQHLGALMEQLSPLIYKEVQHTSGSLPRAALSSAAKRWTIKAIETYDPTKGAALSTHVTSYLRKVRRMNYKFQNAVMLPEDKHRQFESFRHARETLTEQLSREPTDEELASHVGWSKPQVIKFKKSLYDDLTESGEKHPVEFVQSTDNAFLMEYLNHTLSPDEKFILHNFKEMPAKDLAEKLGVNISRLNYLKGKLIKRIKEVQVQLGDE